MKGSMSSGREKPETPSRSWRVLTISARAVDTLLTGAVQSILVLMWRSHVSTARHWRVWVFRLGRAVRGVM